jgi:hypothetical protein
VNKKTFLSAATILALLISLVAGLQVVEVAKANSIRLYWVPTSPDTSLPQVTIGSPSQNTTYNSNEIPLNFTVVMPESWFTNDPTGQAPIGDYCNGKILSIQIIVDDKQVHNISVSNDSYLPYSSGLPLRKNLTISANLGVSEGNHILIVHVIGESYYMPTGNSITEHYPVNSDSTPISFYANTSTLVSTPTIVFPTVAASTLPTQGPSPIIPSNSPTQQPTIEPTPTSDNNQAENFTPIIIIVGLAAVAVAVGLLVYFKRCKK